MKKIVSVMLAVVLAVAVLSLLPAVQKRTKVRGTV